MMRKLILPGVIHVDFVDGSGKHLLQENILIGIHSFARTKNNIDLWPFLSGKDGRVFITKEQLQMRADRVITSGLMDYSPLDTAYPEIQIYFWGNASIDRYLEHWRKNPEASQREELHVIENCFNRKTTQQQDIILITDTWDQSVKEKNYEITLSL